MNHIQHLKLPVGPRPGWEFEDNHNEEETPEFKSVAESLVILQSIKQSRDKWLHYTFPRFSSKSRGGKPPEVVPPPHTIYNRGRCDLEIGPHVFLELSIFEVHYYPIITVSAAVPSYASHFTTSQSWQTTTPYHQIPAHSYEGRPGAEPILPSTGFHPSAATTSLLSSSSPLPPSVSITPAWISKVNAAASSNPTLSSLLQVAASGNASSEQLKSLGLLMQSLANSPASTTTKVESLAKPSPSPPPRPATPPTVAPKLSHPAVSSASGSTQMYSPLYTQNTKEFDIVLEFKENPSDRWIFPRGVVACAYTPSSGAMGSMGDIMLSTLLPFAKPRSITPALQASQSDPNSSPTEEGQEVVTFQFTKASSAIWDSFSRWAGPQSKMEENSEILKNTASPDRVYLAHQLRPGPMLTQVQNAANPPFATKPIKPPQADSTRPKRKPAPRKATQETGGSKAMTVSSKRKRHTSSKPPMPAPKIACFACGKTDVPLIMSGRYCRPCVEAGRATNEMPPQPGVMFTYRLPHVPESATTVASDPSVVADSPRQTPAQISSA